MTDEIKQRIIRIRELGDKFAKMAKDDQQLSLKLKSMSILKGKSAMECADDQKLSSDLATKSRKLEDGFLELTKKSEWSLRIFNHLHEHANDMIAKFDRSA